MIKASLLAGALVVASVLTGCGTTLPPVPQSYRQSVVVAGITYGATSRAALVYAQQPRCSATRSQSCADLATVVQLGRASRGVEAALKVAEAVPPTAPEGTRTAALAAVMAALADFEAHTKTAAGK